MKKYLLIAFLLITSVVVKAQCPYNLEAIDTSWAGWQIFSGTVIQGPNATTPSVPTGMNLITHFTAYNAPSRDTMTGGNGLDPYGAQTGYYTLPYVCPFITYPNGGSNTHSLRVGNDITGSQCDRISYKYRVPSTFTRFFAQFYYAFVLESAGHTFPEQPRFTISVIDSATGLKVNCNDFQLVADFNTYIQDSLQSSPSNPATSFGGVLYKKWTPATINLKFMNGRTVYFVFEAADCAFGGHFGYGYVDFAGCSESMIQQVGCWKGTLTPTNDTFIGPKHSSFAAMKWYKKNPFTVANEYPGMANKDTLIRPAVIAKDSIFVLISPLPGFGCLDTFKQYIYPPAAPVAYFKYPLSYCNNSPVSFGDSSWITTTGDYVSYWKWDFGDGTGFNYLQNPQHAYTSNGLYTVSLIIGTHNGCISDTTYQTININRNVPPAQFNITDTTICAPIDSTIISLINPVIPGAQYIWNYPAGLVKIRQVGNSITFKGTGTGYKSIGVHLVPAPGDTTCDLVGTTIIRVKGYQPAVFLAGDDSICLHDVATINVSSKPINCGPTITPCSAPTSYSIGTNNAPTSNVPTPFRGNWTESKCQMLFTAQELLAMGFHGGTISEISWNVITKNSTVSTCNTANGQYAGFTIKMACVPYNTIYTGTTASLDLTTPLTTVYTTNSYNTTVGVNTFVLQTQYDWDGVSNLLVQTCYDANPSSTTSCFTQDDPVTKSVNPPGQNLCAYAYSDNNLGCDPNYGATGNGFATGATSRPDITFKGCNASLSPSVTITWSANPSPFTSVTYSRDSIQVSPLVSTNYLITASENGCDTKVPFFVDQMTKNTVNIFSANTTVCAGSSVTMLASGTGPAPLVPVPCSINTTGGCSGTPTLTPKIGNGNVSKGSTPFDYNYQNYRMLMRYSGASLTAAMGAGPKTITSFDWNITNKTSFIAFGNFTVSMQCVNSSWVFPTANFPSSGSVVRSPSNFTTVSGWNTINLTNSYNWDGVSDLLIEVCFSSAGFSSPDDVQGTTMASNCVLSAGNASAVLGCTIPSGTASNVLPNIRFNYCSINVNPSVLNYHWTSQRKTIPAGTPVDTNMISLTMMKTDTFIAHLMGTSIMPFCPVQDTIIITVTNLLATNKTHDTIVCENTLLPLYDTITSAGNRTVAWKWSTSDGRHLSCKTCPNPIDTVSSNHKIFVEVTSQFGCIQYDTINVFNPFIPTADFTTISPVCLNANSTLTYTGTAGAGPYNFNWNFGGNSTPPSGLLTRGPLAVNWSTPGLKTITLTVDTIGCTSTFTNTVDVIPALSATFSLNKHIICAGDSVQLTYLGTSNSIPQVNFLATSVGSVIHKNNAGIAPVNLSYATAGKYYITLTVDYGATKMCQVTYTDSIIVNPIPTSTFTVNKTDICSGDNVLVTYTGYLNPTGGLPTYTWNFANPTSITNGTTNAYDTTLSWTNTNSTVGIKNITLTVTQDGCISTQTLNTVKVHVIPVAKIDINFIATCSGPGSLTSLSSSGSIYENTPTANFIWTSSPLPTIPSSTTFSGLGQKGSFLVDYSNDTSLVKQYQMLQIIENGCTSNIAVDSIDVIPVPISSFRIIPDKICSGTSATFEFNGIIDTACTNCTKGFKWTFDNPRLPLPSATNNGKKQSVIFDNQSGFNEGRTGTLEITDTRTYPNASNVVCKSKPYTAPVIVYPLPNITITGPQDICDKVTSYLSTSESYVRYQWSNGDTNDTIKVVNGGDYSVIVTDVNNCVNQATTHVTVHPIPVANAGEDQLIFVGNSAFLNASRSYGGDSYLWTPNRNIDAPTIISPVVSPTETTPYILTYYNSAVGCTDYDTVIINVRDCEPLVVPNAFTPNGDNIDDYFMVLNPNDYYRLVRLEIYNRWGELVYATNDKNNKGWDGQFRGVNQEVGTYIYHVTAECGGGKLMNIKGDVTLLR